jgi:hypothetical protein
MHGGKVFVNAGMLSGRMRRRFTTAPVWSSPTTLQLFFPRSIPRTAICIGPLLPSGCSRHSILPEEEGRAIP